MSVLLNTKNKFMGKYRIILEIKEKSDHSLVFFSEEFRNVRKKKEALKKKNISLELLPAINRLLKKNRLSLDPAPISGKLNNKKTKKRKVIAHKNWCGVDKISGYKIISDVPKNWTSVRIAEITLKSLKIAGLAR